MNLDPDQMRNILLSIEKDQRSPDWELSISNGDYDRYYAASKLKEAGFIIAEEIPGTDEGEEYLVIRELTFSGHEFLEGIRDTRAWKFIKNGAKGLRNMSVQVLMELSKEYLAAQIRNAIG